MSCYRDSTFCRFHKDCHYGYCCQRALTEKVDLMAEKLGLPICQFAEKPKCFEEKIDDGNK